MGGVTTNRFCLEQYFWRGFTEALCFPDAWIPALGRGGAPGDSEEFVPSLLMATVPKAGAETRC